MTTLCTELVLRIIDEATADGDKRTARVCSEVGRYWVYPSRPVLFHMLRIDSEANIQCWNSLLNVNAKQRADFAIPPHVHRLVIWRSGQLLHRRHPVTTSQLIARFSSITMLDLRGAALDWDELRGSPLTLVRCLTLQYFSLSHLSYNVVAVFPSLTILNIRDTVLEDVDSSAEDEETVNSIPPGLRDLSLSSIRSQDVYELIHVLRDVPYYWSVRNLIIRCTPHMLNLIFASIPWIKTRLETLICIPRGTLRPVIPLENIELLNHLGAFGFQLLDLDVDTVLPRFSQISSPLLYSLTIGYGLTLLADMPLDLSPAWDTFKDTISDPSRFPHLVGLHITIFDAGQCGMLFMLFMEYSLRHVFVSLIHSPITITIHIRGQ
ncbi:hypothetical protein ARMSODRAFT_1022094 [Armillaria solidipes]|uniref:F-box domain-containing protein n=1 Tax=Armillaria solidipes TaxID=1076256 RepID=A0A2H3BF29_9AGAR|nr:hypothetical protein ARMSODRAFT_1022094 [Armillaria solidipes]